MARRQSQDALPEPLSRAPFDRCWRTSEDRDRDGSAASPQRRRACIVNWRADNIGGFGGPALVVYENGKIPNMLAREGLPDDVVVVTSRTFLVLAAEAGYLADAEMAWAVVAAKDPRANPSMNYQLIKATRP